jgi:hypothetical protein
MPGSRDRNLRAGDLQEELGILLLKAIAFVAAVPRQEDAGNDAVATLIRPEGSRKLIPGLTFFVQLKSESTKSVSYTTPDEVAWISSLEVPLFIGRVYLREGKIELFTTQRLHQVLLEQPYEHIELLLDSGIEQPAPDGGRRLNVGPPVHSWSLAEAADLQLLVRSHAILRPHIEALQANRHLRVIQSHKLLQWETGQPPTEGSEMVLVRPEADIADTLRSMVTHARRLMFEVQFKKKYGDFPVLLAFFDLMRRWGTDPDPSGVLRQMAGVQAQGPDITVEQAIAWRHMFRANSLSLHGLPLTNESLASIPADVSKLALTDTVITDDGIPQLLRLQDLSRLNLAGTKITDDGLQQLGASPKLEWVSVKRTGVTPEGIDHLRRSRPDIIVDSDAAPGDPDALPSAT